MQLKTRLGRVLFAALILPLLSGFSPKRIETTQPWGSSALEGRAIEQLPLQGGNFADLVVLQPGIVSSFTQSWIQRNDPFTLGSDTFRVEAIAGDGEELLGLGGPDGLMTLDTRTGTKTPYSGLSGVVNAISFSEAGRMNVGIRADGPGKPTLFDCFGGLCTANSSVPFSSKAGDSIRGFTVVPGTGTYAFGSTGVWFARDHRTFVDRSAGLSGAPYNALSCRFGVCVLAANGGLFGGAAGQTTPWSRLLNGFPANTGGFTGATSDLDGFLVIAGINSGLPYVQPYTLAGFDLSGSWQATAQVEDGLVKYGSFATHDLAGKRSIGLSWGIFKFDSAAWRTYISFPDLPSISSVRLDNGLLRAGGDRTYPSYDYSLDLGRTWGTSPLLNVDIRHIVSLPQYDIGLGRDGIFRISLTTGGFTSVTGLPTGTCAQGGFALPDGTVTIRTNDSGFFRFDSGYMSVAPFNVGLPNPSLPTTGLFGCGSTLYGFREADAYWNSGGGWNLVPSFPPPDAGFVTSGICLDNGMLRLGTKMGRVLTADPSTFTVNASSTIAPGARVNQFLQLGTAYSFVHADRYEDVTAGATTTEFAATSRGLYASVDGGATWFPVDRKLGTLPVTSLAADQTHLFVGTAAFGLVVYSLPIQFRQLVPVVVDVETGTAHYTSEVVVTNRNTTTASATLQYTASLGSGSGVVADTIAAGRQLVIPDVMDYLRQKGLTIPVGGSQAGTLLVTFGGITDGDAVAVTVRTTAATSAPLPAGRAGLAYSAIDPASGTDGSLYLFGIRSSDTDRANVAVFNTSAAPVSVRVTAFSGSGDGRSQVVAASDPIPAWGWKQYNRVLDAVGFTNGWVRIDRVSGAKTYFSAYAVINDNATNDGSFVLPARGSSLLAYANVPVIVETPAFSSEFVLANSGSSTATFHLTYQESLGGPGGGTATVMVPPQTQLIQANAIAWLRSLGIPIGAAGAASYAGSVHVEVDGVSPDQIYAGARTASLVPGGGEFGLFTPAFTPGTEGETEAFIYGLRADSGNRSNVACIHTGGSADGSITLSIQAYDGDAGGAPAGAATTMTLNPGQWKQLDGFLGQQGVVNGWVKVTRTAGIANWIAYGVINDGGTPNQGTGDGAYVPMSK